LCIGIADNEVHAFNILTIHVINGVAAATTDTDDFYDGRFFFRQIKMNHKKFFVLLPTVATVENFLLRMGLRA